MKRKLVLIVVILIVLALAASILLPVGQPFTLPFAAEDVSCVILFRLMSGYMEVTEAEDIAKVVEAMNEIRLCGTCDPEPEEGNYGCTYYFFLQDGRRYELHTAEGPFIRNVLTDDTGTKYKIKKFPLYALWNELDVEVHPGGPFQSEYFITQ